jgi:hypothetical protein
MRKFVLTLLGLFLCASLTWADSLELKNGSLIKGKYMGGDQTSVSFQVGSSVQRYNTADIVSLTFDASTAAAPRLAPATSAQATKAVEPVRALSSTEDGPMLMDRGYSTTTSSSRPSGAITIPAGTMISIRTIDAIDSDTNHIGDRFQASLQEPIEVDGITVAPKGADVYGRLSEAQESGHLAGRSQLKLELTGIVIDGRTQPVVTGEYEVKGSSRTASTAKKSVGGAALGAIIGGVAGGGKGAAIGAGVGAGAGAGINVITKGEQVKVPAETLLEFRLQQSLTIQR